MYGVRYKEPKTLLKVETKKMDGLIENVLSQVAKGAKTPEEAASYVSESIKTAADSVVGYYQNPDIKEGLLTGANKALELFLLCGADPDNDTETAKASRRLQNAIAEAELAGFNLRSIRDQAVRLEDMLQQFRTLKEQLTILSKRFAWTSRKDKQILSEDIGNLQEKGLNVDKLRELFVKIK